MLAIAFLPLWFRLA